MRLLALASSLMLILSACATAPPPLPTTPPVTCDPPARSLKPGACAGSLEPSLLDCMACDGAHGCVDTRRNVYCVDQQGCDDRRCNPAAKEGRDDAILTR